MSFVVRKPGAGAVTLDDLGITVTGLAASERDLRDIHPADIAASVDLQSAISGASLVVLDPRDDSTALTPTEGELARATANDTHFGVSGGRFGSIDAPGSSITNKHIVEYDSSNDEFVQIPVSTAVVDNQATISTIVGNMLDDGSDTNVTYTPGTTPLLENQDETNYDGTAPNGTFVGGDGLVGTPYVALDTITLSDGSIIRVDAVDGNGDVTDFTVLTNSGNVTPGVTLTQAGTSGSGNAFTLTPENPNIQAGSIAVNVDDSFLRNTGDTLDSGTLNVASGATIAILTGGDLTIADLPTNPTDAANKEYVDTVATGLDFKESVHMCTTGDLVTTYNNGAAGLGATLTGTGNGVLPPSLTDNHAHFTVGTRILVKSQTDQTENGLYDITSAGSGEEVSKVVTIADSGDSLNGTYFEFTASNGGYYVWFKTSGGGLSDPAGTGTGIQVNINTNALDAAVTAATIAAINASSAAVVAYVDENDTFFIVDNALGNQTDATDVDSGFTVTTEIQGDGTGTAFVLTRTTDADNSPSNEVSGGLFVFVEDGETCAGTGWVLVEPVGNATLGTDDLVFEQFSGQGLYTGGNGITITGTVIDLDINDTVAETIAGADQLAFNDATDDVTKKTTVTNFLNDLDIVTHGGGNGFLVKTADDTYTNRSIAIDGAGALDGLALTNGDGVSGDPTLGLDIQNLPLRAAIDAATDRVAVYDTSVGANVYYTISDIATAGSAVNSFETWAGAGNTSGDASIVADSATDTVNLTGGIGINIDFTAASDTLTFSFTRAGMADTAVEGTDTVPFFDNGNSNEPEYRAWSDIITDLSLATAAFTTVSGDTGSAVADTASDTLNLTGATNGGITTTASDGPETVTFGITPIDLTTGAATLTTSDFIMVSDSADTASTLALKYTFGTVITDLGLLTSVSASVAEDELGIVVTGGDTIGLDILGLTDPDGDMAATDEFPVHDKSEGTAGANRKMTGQNIADGVAAILDIATLTFDVFPAVTSPADDQTLLAYTDADRSKVLSVESQTFIFSDNSVDDNDWIDVGGASDALTGFIMPLDATIVMASAHTEDANGNTFNIDVYIDQVLGSAGIVTLAGAAEAEDTDPTLSIDVDAGEKINIRADRTAGSSKMGDTVVVLTVRWRS